jgi:DNA repair exonuclease SbcCD ATPase subunit
MDVRALKDLCQRQDELAAILEIMEGEPVIVDLHRESSDALNQALSEIERLRSHADLHRETSNALRDALAEINRLKADAELHQKTSEALRDALAEIERLRSETADLQHTKFDGGLSNLPPASFARATDWFMNFLERKRALTGEKVEKVEGRKSRVE